MIEDLTLKEFMKQFTLYTMLSTDKEPHSNLGLIDEGMTILSPMLTLMNARALELWAEAAANGVNDSLNDGLKAPKNYIQGFIAALNAAAAFSDILAEQAQKGFDQIIEQEASDIFAAVPEEEDKEKEA